MPKGHSIRAQAHGPRQAKGQGLCARIVDMGCGWLLSGVCGGLHVEFHNLPRCKCDCNELSTDDIVDGMALMMRTAPNTRGHMAQVVACLSRACEGIGRVAVSFAQYIDSRIEVEHAPQHGGALSVAEPNTHTPTIKTDVDVLVAEVTEAVEIAPSIICYCGLPVVADESEVSEGPPYRRPVFLLLPMQYDYYTDGRRALAILPSMRKIPSTQCAMCR